MPNIQKIEVDFQVLKTYDPKKLLIADTSQWSHIIDKPAIIEITLPGSKNAHVNYIDKKNTILVFNSSLLGINCGAGCEEELLELPDGIYYIKVKGSPDTFFKERYYMRSERLQLNLDKIYTTLGFDINRQDRETAETLWECKLLIEAADASCRRGEIPMAVDYYKSAKRIIDSNLNCER
jgi:hypothetical protein